MKWLLVCALLWGVAWPALGQNPNRIPADTVTVLRDTTRFCALGRSWALLTDLRPQAAARPLTLAQVRAPFFARQFRPSREEVPNRETVPADYWLRCRVRNESRPATAWLFIAAIPVQPCELFLVADDGRVHQQVLSGQRDWRGSHAVPSNSYNVPVALAPGHTYTLYVHSGAGLFWFGFAERTHYLQSLRLGDVEAAAYFGIMLALVVYNLLLFFSVRDRSYGYYVLFTLSFALLQADMMGYLQQFWFNTLSETAQNAIQHGLLGLTMASSVQTARTFLETARLLPRFDRLLRATLLLAPLPLLSVWVYQLHLAPAVAPLVLCVPLLVAGLWQLRAGYRPARYFMAGWSLLLVAIVLYYLRTLDILPVSVFTEYGVRMASALEVLLLSLGLADRINLARQQRQLAEHQALAALQEKDEVQQKANVSLTQRAQELQAAYSELQASLRTTGRRQELDELKTRFFTNISHELRTPLTLIVGPLDELLHNAAPPDAARLAEQHTLMRRHAARLLELINQLLDIARLEAGQLRLRASVLDLRAFVLSHVAAFDSLAAARGLQLHATVPPDELPACVDSDQLEKVLTNLLGNALKFTPAGGQVRLTLATEPGLAVLSVADTGAGIPAAHLPLVFDRFHQVDDSPNRRHDGSGIGLALVKELVALHHGTVEVASTEGKGTVFTVRLPLGTAHLRSEELVPAPVSSAPKTVLPDSEPALHAEPEGAEDARPFVLVVDDHADMRAYVARCLRAEFRVETAAEGEAGWARIVEEAPDAVVSDLMMPVLDGLELCRRLKTDERTSHIPVVLLTARTHDDSRLAGLELGADDYLQALPAGRAAGPRAQPAAPARPAAPALRP